MPTTYLITGTNRGIGFSYVKKLTENKSNLVIATVRNEKAAAPLLALNRDNLKVIFIDMSSPYKDFETAFAQLSELAPNGVDVFIQNAGYDGPNFFLPANSYDVDSYAEVLTVNVGGAAKTYKAVYPHIFKGRGLKKIILLSTIAGQTKDFKLGANAYGASKAAINHLGVQIAKENAESSDPLVKGSVTLLLHPGFVDTAMAIEPKKVFGEDIFISADESVKRSLSVISKIDQRDTGKFLDEQGNVLEF
jgi:NAD(P)-dependent dehydrogenase (short-subunit alcohol dehydrogenase family)